MNEQDAITAKEQKAWNRRNRYTFGPGMLGQEMVYTMVSMFLIFYLTDIIHVPTASFIIISALILLVRVIDAVTDPLMGFVVDNTHSRWGKYKPWIAIGAILTSVFVIMLFSDFGGISGTLFVVLFSLTYFLWGAAYTINNISLWSMMPSMSFDPKEREKIGAVARICANLGIFFVVVGIVPITGALGRRFGTGAEDPAGYLLFAILCAAFTIASSLVAIVGVKERPVVAEHKETHIKEMFSIIFKNDQLLFISISTILFMTGYITSTNFGLYYFKYVYHDASKYSIFALVLGLSQVLALAIFPLLSKRTNRKKLYSLAAAMVVVGYIGFFFSPISTILFISISGVFIFMGQAMIQLLMLMFIADCVDYGHLKLGKRNDSITFSLSSFIYKVAGAVASGVVSTIVVLSGIKEAADANVDTIPVGGEFLVKLGMMIIPFLFILIGYFIYRAKYHIDEVEHAGILEELKQRGELI